MRCSILERAPQKKPNSNLGHTARVTDLPVRSRLTGSDAATSAAAAGGGRAILPRRARRRCHRLEPGKSLQHGLHRLGHDLAQPRLDLLDRPPGSKPPRAPCPRLARPIDQRHPGLLGGRRHRLTGRLADAAIVQLLATPSLPAGCRSCAAGMGIPAIRQGLGRARKRFAPRCDRRHWFRIWIYPGGTSPAERTIVRHPGRV